MRILIGIVLVLAAALIVGCEEQQAYQPPSQANTGVSEQSSTTTYEEAVESEFIDESDDVTIGEMV